MNSKQQLFIDYFQQQAPIPVLDASIPLDTYVPINLTEDSSMFSELSTASSEEFEQQIQYYLNTYNGNVAFGGYLEKRTIYSRRALFQESGRPSRCIHIGLDLWTLEDTPVLAVADGMVHSFKNNLGMGNYGPTIILQHQIGNLNFFTLYGHLSLRSIQQLRTGMRFRKGDRIGSIGISAVNGDYAPHLHFQVMLDVQKFDGDYPGVCSEEDKLHFMLNCPDPNILLKLPI
jgi:murein DD-endopeptidase MepM/ murein hydrolase activator NlpD